MPTTSQAPSVIRDRLKAAGASQEAVASLLGISQQAVSRRLTGEVDFKFPELSALASLLSVTLDELTTPLDSPSPEGVALAGYQGEAGPQPGTAPVIAVPDPGGDGGSSVSAA